MKGNAFKYIFIVFVIGLISFAGYKIYNDEKNNQTQNETAADEPKTTIVKDIRLAIAGFDTINPLLSNNYNVQDISKLVFEPLLTVNQNYKIEAVLAKEWSRTGDTSYIIKLKDNVKWQDGTEFTAYDVEFTIDVLKQIQSIYSYNVQNIVGVDVIDKNTLKINLDAPRAFFEYNLIFPILSKTYYQTEDVFNRDKSKKSLGTGMYYIASVDSNLITLKKNRNWWNDNPLEIETVNISLFDSMGEVYNSFKMGNIDLITTRSLNYEEYIGTIGFSTKEYKGREHDFIAINSSHNILSKTEVRKAISYCIDKNAINANVYAGRYDIVDFPIADSYLYTAENPSAGYNPEQAKQVLLDNGWEYKYSNWQKIENYRTLRLSFNLVVNSSDEKRCQAAEVIKENLSQIGIKLNIVKVSDNQYNNYLERKNYEMILTGTTTGVSPDMSYYFGEDNLGSYTNAEVTTILNDLRNINDEKLLKEKYKKLYEIYKNEAPYISLYFNKNVLLYSSNLRGEITPNNYNIFYNLDKWYREY